MTKKEEDDEKGKVTGLTLVKEMISVSPSLAWVAVAVSVIVFFREPITEFIESNRVQEIDIVSVFSVK